ncbi:MAG: N-6 DNA methylase [Aggregatilineales bacterium]
MYSLIQQSLAIGQEILNKRTSKSRKANGQFLTPEALARFIADQLGDIRSGEHVLDPAMGSGTLMCAVIERLIEEGEPIEVYLDGFELDEELYTSASALFKQAVNQAAEYNIKIHLRLFNTDFVLNSVQFLRPSLLETPVGEKHYHHILANPPYFKINGNDSRRKATEELLGGHTNIYTLFMGLSARMLNGGRACFIVPRSFCSGTYFKQFRREFIERASIQHVHLFEARNEAFSQDDVLQENLIITFTSQNESSIDDTIEISSSASLEALKDGVSSRQITEGQFLSPLGLFRLPTSELDEEILVVVDSWKETLHSQGLEISTGPVVAFRAKQYLQDKEKSASSVPLLWMQHIKLQEVTWPLNGNFRKQQYIESEPTLMVKNANYVLLRRFSAKEEARRLVAAPYLAKDYPYFQLGLENHLNYIYGQKRELTTEETIGLSGLLNSGLIDRYFRISNGNTQVNATELRALPIPSLSVITAIGKAIIKEADEVDLDAVVVQVLQTYMLIPNDFPILRETRVL